jgi:hypothetical protein
MVTMMVVMLCLLTRLEWKAPGHVEICVWLCDCTVCEGALNIVGSTRDFELEDVEGRCIR